MSDEIHDMIQQFDTATMGMDELLDIMDKLNEKINKLDAATRNARAYAVLHTPLK